ncbi:MAG: branched-chain amino acid ABC transporter permease, partial [Nitrososphaerota archaeon]
EGNNFFSIYVILSLSLNLEYGFTGIPNFGKVFFFSLGAYVTGTFVPRVMHFLFQIDEPICSATASTKRIVLGIQEPAALMMIFIMSLILSGIIGAVVGYILSYPSLKLRGDYLAISLLIVAELCRVFVRTEPSIVCGTNGIGGLPNPFIWIEDAITKEVSYSTLSATIAFLTYFFIQRIVNSPYGRVLKSIRDDELASQLLGKDVKKFKSEVLMFASSLSAIAGCLYAFFIGFVYPDDFIIVWTMYAWLMLLLGGVGNNRGVVLGSLVMVMIDRGLRRIPSFWLSLPFDISYLRGIIFMVLLLVIIMYRPRGIFPEKPLETPAKKVFETFIRNSLKFKKNNLINSSE